MSIIRIDTPFNIQLEFVIASLRKRVFAAWADIGILMVYMALTQIFIVPPVSPDGMDEAHVLYMFGVSVLPFVYFPICEIILNGQTLGKKMLGIKVVDKGGKEPTIGQYLLRWLLGLGNYVVFTLPYLVVISGIMVFSLGFFIFLMYLVAIVCACYLPDFLCAAVSSQQQRFGDLAAGTVVIDIGSRIRIQETIYLDMEGKDQQVMFPEVMRLSDHDINGIRNLLNRRKTKDNLTYMSTIVTRIKSALHIHSELSDSQFLIQLMKDYNYLTQKD